MYTHDDAPLTLFAQYCKELLSSITRFPTVVEYYTTELNSSGKVRTNLQTCQNHFTRQLVTSTSPAYRDVKVALRWIQGLALYLLIPLDWSSPLYEGLLMSPALVDEIMANPSASQRYTAIQEHSKLPQLNSRSQDIKVCLQCGKFKKPVFKNNNFQPELVESAQQMKKITFFTCGYCNVFMVCSEDCFALAWKNGHKKNCHRWHKQILEFRKLENEGRIITFR